METQASPKKPPTTKRKDRALYQNSAGQWVVDCYIHGRRIRRTVGSKTEAKAFLAREKEKARLDQLFPERAAAEKAKAVHRLTIRDLVDRFAQQLRTNNRSWKSPQKSGEVAAAFFGSKPISEITAEDIEAFKTARLNTRVDRKYKDPVKMAARPKLAPATVNRDLARLKRLLNLAVASQLLAVNPMAKRGVSMLPEENMRYDYLTPAQQKLFRPYLPTNKYRMMRFNCFTGLRTTELLTLHRSMCSLQNATLTLPKVKAKKNLGRIVHLGPKALRLLAVILASHDSEWVFPSASGKPLVRRNWNRTFERARNKVIAHLEKENSPMLADFPRKATPYTCRHTYGSLAAASGIDPNTIKAQMGHASLSVTERYMHLSPSHTKRMVKLYG